MADDYPAAMRPWEEAADVWRTQFPLVPEETLRSIYEQGRAHSRFESMENQPVSEHLIRMLPGASSVYTARTARAYSDARQRISSGSARTGGGGLGDLQNDYNTVAAYERLQDIARNRTMGERIGVLLEGIPAVIGESMAAASVLATPRVVASSGSVIGDAIRGAGRAIVSPESWRRNAARTALVPSMWAPQWIDDNVRNQRDPLNPRGLPAALVMGYMNTAVLGSLGGIGNSIGGTGVRPVVGRILARTTTGMLEQQGVDLLASAVSEVLPEAYKIQRGYGLAGLAARGEWSHLGEHALSQAITFAAFSSLHEYQSHREAAMSTVDPLLRGVRDMERNGVSREVALREMSHVTDSLRSEVEQRGQMTRAEVIEWSTGWRTEPQRQYAESLAATFPETKAQESAQRPPAPTTEAQQPVQGVRQPAEIGLADTPLIADIRTGKMTMAELKKKFDLTYVDVPIAPESAPEARTGQNQPVAEQPTAVPAATPQQPAAPAKPFAGMTKEQIAQLASVVAPRSKASTPEQLVKALRKFGMSDIAIQGLSEANARSMAGENRPLAAAGTMEKAAEKATVAEQGLAAVIGEEIRTPRTSGPGEVPVEHIRDIERSTTLHAEEKDALRIVLSGESLRQAEARLGSASYETIRKRAQAAFDKMKAENPNFMSGIDTAAEFLFELRIRERENMATAPAAEAEPSRGYESVLDQLVHAEEMAREAQIQARLEERRVTHAGSTEHRAPADIRARIEAARRATRSATEGERPGGEAERNAPPEPPEGIYGHGAVGDARQAPAPGVERGAVGPHDIIEFIRQASDVPTYTGQVPGGLEAAAVVTSKQTIKRSMSKADVPIAIEEMSHHDVKANNFQTDPRQLPADVARGFLQFSGGKNMTERNMVEGFGQWAVRRSEGTLANLTPEQKAAAGYAEMFLAQSRLADRYNQIRNMVGRWRGQDPQGQAQSLVSATGTGVDQTAGTAAETAYDTITNMRGAAERFDAEVASQRRQQGLKPIGKGETLEMTLIRDGFLAPEFAEQMRTEGIFDHVVGPDGLMHRRRISGPMSDVTVGINPTDLIPWTMKRGDLPVESKASRFDTFLIARSVVSEVTMGANELARQMALPEKARDSRMIELANKKIATAPADQVEAFRRYLDHEQANDPAFFAAATAAAKRYTKRSNLLMQTRVSIGTMTEAQRQQWIVDHPDYVPLNRVMDTGTSEVSLGSAREGGSSRPFVAPMESMKARELKVSSEVVRQMVFENLLKGGTFDANGHRGMGKFFREVKDVRAQSVDRVALDAQLEAAGYDPQMRQQIIESFGKNIDIHSPWQDGGRNIYYGMENGKPVALEIMYKPLYELLTLKEGSSHFMVSALAGFAEAPLIKQGVDLLKLGATGANMVFGTKNIIRDAPTYFQNTNAGFLTALTNLVKGQATSLKYHFAELLGIPVTDPYVKAFEHGGGEMMRSQGDFVNGGIWPIQKGKQLLRLLGFAEAGPRLAEMKHTLITEFGRTPEQIRRALESDPNTSPIPISEMRYALDRAAKVTVDFANTGAAVKQYNKIDPFFGAHMASMIQEARNWKSIPARMGTLLGMYLAAEVAHNWLFKDEEWYTQLPAHQRHNWFVLFKDSEGRMWSVPKPQGIMRMVGAYAQELLRKATDRDGRLGMATESAVDTAKPRLLPYGAGEAVDIARNRSWSGQPVVPRHADNMEEFDKWVQYRVPYLVEQMTGSLLRPRTAQRAWSSEEGSFAERTGLGMLRNPLQGLQSSQTPPHQSVQDFYELHAELQREYSRANQRGERSDREFEYRTLTSAKERMDRLAAELRGMRTTQRGGRVEDEPVSDTARFFGISNPPPQDEQRRIREEMLELAITALERVR